MRNPFRKKNRIRSETRTVVFVASVLMALFVALIAAAAYLDPSTFHEARANVRRLTVELAHGAKRVAAGVSTYIVEQPYFAVQEIKVFGADTADRAELISSAGLKRGLSIWRIDPHDLERKMRRHPWVKRVVVRREFPRRVIVDVEEWQAAGVVALDGLYYVDAKGVVFKGVGETEPVDFPLITGLRGADLPPHDPSTRSKLSQVLAFGREVEQSGLRLSEIRFVPGGGILLYPASERIPFTMGWGDWAEKLLRLKRFLREWEGQEAHFAAVDMSFVGQAVVRLRQSL